MLIGQTVRMTIAATTRLGQWRPRGRTNALARPAQALYCWPLALALLLSLALVGHELWPDLQQQRPNWLRRRP